MTFLFGPSNTLRVWKEKKKNKEKRKKKKEEKIISPVINYSLGNAKNDIEVWRPSFDRPIVWPYILYEAHDYIFSFLVLILNLFITKINYIIFSFSFSGQFHHLNKILCKTVCLFVKLYTYQDTAIIENVVLTEIF